MPVWCKTAPAARRSCLTTLYSDLMEGIYTSLHSLPQGATRAVEPALMRMLVLVRLVVVARPQLEELEGQEGPLQRLCSRCLCRSRQAGRLVLLLQLPIMSSHRLRRLVRVRRRVWGRHKIRRSKAAMRRRGRRRRRRRMTLLASLVQGMVTLRPQLRMQQPRLRVPALA